MSSNPWWVRLVSFSKNADWPLILGVFFIILLFGLLAAITIRHHARTRLLTRSSKEHFTSRRLPVAYLSAKSGQIEDMLLNPSQFVTFGILNKAVANSRHGMCTDNTSWSHFCLLAAAEAYQRLGSGCLGQFGKKKLDENETLDSLIHSSIQDLAEPYTRYLFSSKTTIPKDKIDEAIVQSRTAARGVARLPPIDDISNQNVSIVSI